jgi:phosphatidate cytidylyltransferase
VRWPRLGAATARRLLSAVVFIPAFLWLLRGGQPVLFSLFVLLLGARAQWEFTRMFARAGAGVYRWIGLVAGVGVTGSFLAEDRMPLVFTAVVVLLLSLPLTDRQPPAWGPTALTLLGVCYVNWLLGFAIWLRRLPEGPAWIVFLLAVTWLGEAAAWVVGPRLGRYLLAPTISPAKTIEGAVAQLVVSTAAAVPCFWWFFPGRPLGAGLLAGALLGLIGQCGDLAESVLKRSAHTKDTGGVIPGHGGVLDRLDSLLFNTPALFYYARHMS